MTLLRHLRETFTGHRPKEEEERKIVLLAVTPWLADQESLRRIAARQGWELIVADTLAEAKTILTRRTIPVILCDRDLPDVDWTESLRAFLEPAGSRCVVLISAVNDEYLLREVVHRGGYDVILKPLQEEERVVSAVQLAWNFWHLGRV